MTEVISFLPAGYRAATKRQGKVSYQCFVRPDGSMSGGFTSREQMEQAAEVEYRRSRLVTRPCICCGAHFKSQGAHHRMCNDCRTTASEFNGC